MDRINLSTNTKWEGIVSYSRAVRIGNLIEVSGTVANDGKKAVFIGDPYGQTKFILEKIEKSLQALGAHKNDIIRSRVYITNVSDWEHAGRAHGEFFEGINPASAMIQIAGLISKEYLVEIEVTAMIGGSLKQNIVLE